MRPAAEDGGFEPPRAFTQHAFQARAPRSLRESFGRKLGRKLVSNGMTFVLRRAGPTDHFGKAGSHTLLVPLLVRLVGLARRSAMLTTSPLDNPNLGSLPNIAA